jgi:hypothetical protein
MPLHSLRVHQINARPSPNGNPNYIATGEMVNVRRRMKMVVGLALFAMFMVVMLILGAASPTKTVLSVRMVGPAVKPGPFHKFTFSITSNNRTELQILDVGAQIRCPSGWAYLSIASQRDVWHLKSGKPFEFDVEPPSSIADSRFAHTPWRVYVRYDHKIKGWELLKIRLKEMWKLRTFRDPSSGAGKFWGGPRSAGFLEVYSNELD